MFILNPPFGITGIDLKIGDSFRSAPRALEAVPGAAGVRTLPGGGACHAYVESLDLGLAVHRDKTGSVDALEVYGPGFGGAVEFGGIDVFSVPADDLIGRLSRDFISTTEDSGLFFLIPDLLLSFSRAGLPVEGGGNYGFYFESVLVAAPGYY